jgi:hypothetical protein
MFIVEALIPVTRPLLLLITTVPVRCDPVPLSVAPIVNCPKDDIG